jgi:integral membrane sensor domain MASE1
MRATGPDLADRPRHNLLQSLFASLLAYCTWKNLSINVVLTAGYFLTGELGVLLSRPLQGTTPVWLPAGISLAAVLLQGWRMWPGIFGGSLLINVYSGAPFIPSLGLATSSTFAALLGAYLVNRFAHGKQAFFHGADALRFVILGALATVLCAAMGTVVICAAGLQGGWLYFGRLFGVWWVGDLLGILLICPFLVNLLGHNHPALRAGELFELSVLLGLLSLICVLNFGPSLAPWIPKSGLFYLCAPCLVWAAIRFCPLEASGATLLMGGFVMWGSLHGYGLFASPTNPPYLSAGYVAVGCATTLVGAAAFAEQGRNVENALRTYYGLKQKYDEAISAGLEKEQSQQPVDVGVHAEED